MKKLKNEELNRLSVEEFKKIDKHKASIILDDVRSALNVGSVFRTCDAFLADHIYLCGISAVPPHRELRKSALGAEKSMNWTYRERILEQVQALKKSGYRMIGVEQTDIGISLEEFFPQKETQYGFIFGNEVFGVNEEVLKLCDEIIEIPQFGTKHSLNISVSVGVILWDYVCKIKKSLPKTT